MLFWSYFTFNVWYDKCLIYYITLLTRSISVRYTGIWINMNMNKYQVKRVSHMERISQWHRKRQTSAWAKREPVPFPDHQGGNRDWATFQEPELEGLLLLKQATETCHLLSEGTHYELRSLTWPLPDSWKYFLSNPWTWYFSSQVLTDKPDIVTDSTSVDTEHRKLPWKCLLVKWLFEFDTKEKF
jgi:hypothetical protein